PVRWTGPRWHRHLLQLAHRPIAPQVTPMEANSKNLLDQDVVDENEEQYFHDGRSWYVIHTYSGYENRVKTNLEHRIESMDAGDLIHAVVVPTVDEIEVHGGVRR